MTKIFMVSNSNAAASLPRITATVEAEFGDECLEGLEVTMAHHGPRSANPAPCNWPYVGRTLNDEDVIVVSHMDLDTIGGIMSLIGVKPEDHDFWQGAELIDVRGYHHAHELPVEVQDKLNAYFAWTRTLPQAERLQPDECREVTECVQEHVEFIVSLLTGDNTNAIEAGRIWAYKQASDVEACLLYENEYVRVFKTERIFCNCGYYSPVQKNIIPACVALNATYDSITLSFADASSLGLSARAIVQAAWGPLAGGHDGIAGSPRGQVMTEDDLGKIARTVAIVVKAALSK